MGFTGSSLVELSTSTPCWTCSDASALAGSRRSVSAERISAGFRRHC